MLLCFVTKKFGRPYSASLDDAPRLSAPREPFDNLLRERRRFEPRRIARMPSDQDAGLERLDCQRLALEHLVGNFKTRTLEPLDPALDGDPVAVGRGDMEFRPCIHHGNADQAIFPDDVLFGKAG